ncbi:hypothetical protein KO500_01520 [Cellulophaga baltica]|uniref:hypothetical protein n=1 Tax=Cellulophaga TaxID=104264 RepID=UPI001C06D8F5|nr:MULTISPECIES: hypothetical protein [Cellulophaga]MBU2995088.1 hypothetical protein [Cellulophaga baltica]MDO6766483.1 hypothetical protein [Cellulophaga sp. 1_MG-2023]
MKVKITYLILLFLIISIQKSNAQESENYKNKIEQLKKSKNQIVNQEKEALKLALIKINEDLDSNIIVQVEAKQLKEALAKKHALNIENRIAILDNEIALLERNHEAVMFKDSVAYGTRIVIGYGNKDIGESRIFGVKVDKNKSKISEKYDRRTYSDAVFAVGVNNTIIEGQSLEDSPYKIGGSRFFEMGWEWRTRIFKNSNFVRFNYGFLFQFNGLKPKDNQYFVNNNGQIELEEFAYDLDKSKLRTDNLVFPLHLEFGPSKVAKTESKIRYNVHNMFVFGIGGYGGFNLGTRQKLKYEIDGEKVKDKFKRSYNTSNFIYGLSAYVGVGGTQMYVKYDLNPLFKDAIVEQRNISLGLRFDL